MITLYGFGNVHPKVIGETRDLRVEWALHETGLPYRVHGLDHSAGELSGEAYSRISPFKQVPVIDDEGFEVAESGAIVLYLAQKSGKLIPSDPQGRARVTQWCFAALNTVEMPLAELLMIDMAGTEHDKEQRRPKMLQWAERVLGNLDRRLQNHPWVASDDFSAADLLLAMVLREIRNSDILPRYPRVATFYERAFARPAWEQALQSYSKRLGVAPATIR